MTQKDKLIKNVEDKLEKISTRLKSYKEVDATLSDNTLMETLFLLGLAENALEDGFVKDSCNEIEEQLRVN